MKYNEIIEQLKELQEDLVDKMTGDDKLLHLTDSEIMQDLQKFEASIENIEYLLQENKRI